MERVLDDVGDASDDLRQLLGSHRWQLFARAGRPLEASLYLGLQQAVHYLCAPPHPHRIIETVCDRETYAHQRAVASPFPGLLGRRIASDLPPDIWALVLQQVLAHRGRPALRRFGYLRNGTLK
eukprot:5814678-Prymnesium_polylepis.1